MCASVCLKKFSKLNLPMIPHSLIFVSMLYQQHATLSPASWRWTEHTIGVVGQINSEGEDTAVGPLQVAIKAASLLATIYSNA